MTTWETGLLFFVYAWNIAGVGFFTILWVEKLEPESFEIKTRKLLIVTLFFGPLTTMAVIVTGLIKILNGKNDRLIEWMKK